MYFHMILSNQFLLKITFPFFVNTFSNLACKGLLSNVFLSHTFFGGLKFYIYIFILLLPFYNFLYSTLKFLKKIYIYTNSTFLFIYQYVQIINSSSNGYFQVLGITKTFVKVMETVSTTRVSKNS